MPKVLLSNLDECFTYHGPNEGQVAKYQAINEAAKAFAKAILENCPDGRERAVAMTDIQSARMWANASVALEHIP